MQRAQVVYGVNSGYVLPALVSMWSLQRKASRPVEVTLYVEDIGEYHYNTIQQVKSSCGLSISVNDFDSTEFHEYSKITTTRFPTISLLPLLLPSLVDGRCLFIDADTLVLGDVWELLSSDLGGMPIGACIDLGWVTLMDQLVATRLSDVLRPKRSEHKRRQQLYRIHSLGILPGENYFNSGVVVMDCDRIRSDCPGYADLANIKRIQPYVHTFPDQDPLNEFFSGRWFQFPYKWNTFPGVGRNLKRMERRKGKYQDVSGDFRAQLKEATDSPMIWHYLGRRKPWIRRRRRRRMAWKAFRDYVSALQEFRTQTGIEFGM